MKILVKIEALCLRVIIYRVQPKGWYKRAGVYYLLKKKSKVWNKFFSNAWVYVVYLQALYHTVEIGDFCSSVHDNRASSGIVSPVMFLPP